MPASFIMLASLLLVWGADGRDDPPPPADAFQPEPTWKKLGTDLWFDPVGKRVIIVARLVLREGALEHLLCLKNTKEHEAILATAATPRLIHAGLLLTGVEPGHPVTFKPEFKPPRGPSIDIELKWQADGKTQTADARNWIKDERTGKLLAQRWVFAGSMLHTDPTTNQPRYAADDGDLITVANFPSSILDVPFASSADDADRVYVPNTAQLPPRGTVVAMYLKPLAPASQPAR